MAAPKVKRVFLISFAVLFAVNVMPSRGQNACNCQISYADCYKSCPAEQSGMPEVFCADRCSDCIRQCQPTMPRLSPPPKVRAGAYFYRPGDLYGSRYDSLDECGRAQEKAGVGVCMMK
jgi:hypothetical protein